MASSSNPGTKGRKRIDQYIRQYIRDRYPRRGGRRLSVAMPAWASVANRVGCMRLQPFGFRLNARKEPEAALGMAPTVMNRMQVG